jgi:YfiH family protein
MILQPTNPPPWILDQGDLCVRFLGRGAPRSASDLADVLGPDSPQIGWLKQVHSSDAQLAQEGCAGPGDVLYTARPELALSIATADCVPVLLASGDRLAAAHAGWRGLVAGAIPAAVETLDSTAHQVQAWIGPSIGPCCYEVGNEVAESLVEVSHQRILSPGGGERPHADLRAVAVHQLNELGIKRVQWFDLCTHCRSNRLESYRRSGPQAGRNWSLIWRRGPALRSAQRTSA